MFYLFRKIKIVTGEKTGVLIKGFLSDGQKVRSFVQLGFLVLVIWIGYEFYSFVQFHQQGGRVSSFHRPPGVEAPPDQFADQSEILAPHWCLQPNSPCGPGHFSPDPGSGSLA